MNNDPARLTDVPVPPAAEHVFVQVMDALNDADEIYGVPDPDDYIAMMEALKAEIEARINNAKSHKESL